MLLIPAIDLMDSQVVRLKQGRLTEKTVYSDNPSAIAKCWESKGGDWLHLVDLDAAFEGSPKNLLSVRAICQAVTIPCELGGGMRSQAAIRSALEAGITRVVLGTRASESLEFVREMCRIFGKDRIAVSVDGYNGMVAVNGWTRCTNQRVAEWVVTLQQAGVSTIIYTDVTTDGMLKGPNFDEIFFLLSLLSCQLIASGGIASVENLRRLNAMSGLHGAIIGKALYDGHIEGNLRNIL